MITISYIMQQYKDLKNETAQKVRDFLESDGDCITEEDRARLSAICAEAEERALIERLSLL